MSAGIIRIANAADLDGILDLYTHLHENDLIGDRSSQELAYDKILSCPGCFLYLTEDCNMIVSSCTLHILPNLTRGARPYGLIENVVTRRECRSQGYATRLLGHVLHAAWDAGCYKVMLLTGRADPVVFRTYEKAGFIRGKKEGLIAYPPA